MTRPFKTYNGGKNGSGVYQAIINQIPPHEIFISGFAGNCGVLCHKKKAIGANYAIDLEKYVADAWKLIPGVTAVNADVIEWLPKNIRHYEALGESKIFIFLDPPYLKSVRSHQGNLYNYKMDDPASHKRLLAMVKLIPYPVCITHYPCKLYDTELKDWRHLDIQGRTHYGMKTERLYMNYPEPTALHDYRYIGNDYREREEYKKSKRNMIAKFKRMPELERNFIISELHAGGLI